VSAAWDFNFERTEKAKLQRSAHHRESDDHEWQRNSWIRSRRPASEKIFASAVEQPHLPGLPMSYRMLEK
jgi:hypothetical protein